MRMIMFNTENDGGFMCALSAPICVFQNCTVHMLHEVRVMIFGEKQIRFTPIEYSIMTFLLQDRPISDKELVTNIFHSELNMWTREALEKHIVNLRRKLRKSYPKLCILRVATFGYMLILQDG